MDLVLKAKEFAWRKHFGQKDDSGLSYYTAHVEQVFNILRQVTSDKKILCAGLLHDVLEDTNTSHDELVREFGGEIAGLVLELTHEGRKDEYGYYFPRLVSGKAVLVKFADRLSNLSRMGAWPVGRREQYLRRSRFWKSERTK